MFVGKWAEVGLKFVGKVRKKEWRGFSQGI